MRLIILIVLLGLYYIASLYHLTSLLLLSVSLLIFFILLMFLTLFAKVTLSFSSFSVIHKHGDDKIYLEANNQSPFPINKLLLVIHSVDPQGEKRKLKARISLSAREKKNVSLAIESAHLGRIDFYYKKYIIYDFTGLFRKKHALKDHQRIYVLPSPKEVPVSLVFNDGMEGDEHSAPTSGQEGDYTIREYKEGDSLKSIHWNMSARNDLLYVREYESFRRPTFYLHIDLSYQDKECLDDFYRAFYSLVLTALKSSDVIIEEVTRTLLDNPYPIYKEEELDELMILLYDFKGHLKPAMSQGYLLDTKARLYLDGKLVSDLKGGDQNALIFS